MKTVFISHPDFLLHEMGDLHPESPARLRAIDSLLKRKPLGDQLIFVDAVAASREQLLLVHEESYLEFLKLQSPKEGHLHLDMDTVMNPHTLNAAFKAAGALVLAVDMVMEQKTEAAFCAVRPPGHHAEKDKAMGFCFFNNIAVGAAYALQKYNLKKILIVDFDVHHGNGTEYMFERDPRVLICSSFQHPQYPGKRFISRGEQIINIPLAAGSGSAEFRSSITQKWFPQIELFRPEIIFISAGFDAHANDPLAELSLEIEDFVWITQKLVNYAKLYSQSRIISTLEGGYDPTTLAECVYEHLKILLTC
jgi:acetoin utilization deacetylase AcuC-like enzyme